MLPRSILLVLFSLVGLAAMHKLHNLFELSLDSTEKTSPVLTVENGRCFMDLLCVFRCSFQKHFKNGEPG